MWAGKEISVWMGVDWSGSVWMGVDFGLVLPD
jgi:hypothetical protein